jgi:hypothetical protein
LRETRRFATFYLSFVTSLTKNKILRLNTTKGEGGPSTL